MLVSDGGANAGITDADLIGAHAGGQDEDGIYLVGVGVGSATYHDDLMDRVTDLGRGASVFVPHAEESQRMFADRFLETMGVAAREVQIRYDLPPGFEIVRFSAEEVSTDPAEVEPQHVSPNDSMVLHQQLAACGEVDDKAEITVAVIYKDPVTFEPREVVATHRLQDLLAAPGPQLDKGAAVFAYTEAMRGENGGATVSEATAAVKAALVSNPNDPDLTEILQVLDTLTP